jgi:uncharacterized repeat protein (TIGR04138 family)
MTDPISIHGDLPCYVCRYNVRGLPYAGDCPECGTPIEAIVRDSLQLDAETTRALVEAAHRARAGLSAIRLVVTAIRHAELSKRSLDALTHGAGDAPINASDIVRAVGEIAVEKTRNRDAAQKFLTAVGVTSGRDIGRIVFAMVDAGLVRASAQDRIEDYQDLPILR